jgi:hypothetical protein
MKVQATLTHQVEVEPLEFMRQLLRQVDALGQSGDNVVKEDDKYFISHSLYSLGTSTESFFIQIPKERYKYIKAIQLIISKLENDK